MAAFARFCGFDLLGRCEGLRVDNTEVRHLDRLPLAARVGTRDTTTGVGILRHAHLVPHNAARIEVFQDDASTALHIAVNGRCVPTPTAWRWDSLSVKCRGNLAWRFAPCVRGKDALDDPGLVFDDLQPFLPGTARHMRNRLAVAHLEELRPYRDAPSWPYLEAGVVP